MCSEKTWDPKVAVNVCSIPSKLVTYFSEKKKTSKTRADQASRKRHDRAALRRLRRCGRRRGGVVRGAGGEGAVVVVGAEANASTEDGGVVHDLQGLDMK